jgi:hypothetical protein
VGSTCLEHPSAKFVSTSRNHHRGCSLRQPGVTNLGEPLGGSRIKPPKGLSRALIASSVVTWRERELDSVVGKSGGGRCRHRFSSRPSFGGHGKDEGVRSWASIVCGGSTGRIVDSSTQNSSPTCIVATKSVVRRGRTLLRLYFW